MKSQLKNLDDKDREFALELTEAVGAEMPQTRFMTELDLEKDYHALNRISSN